MRTVLRGGVGITAGLVGVVLVLSACTSTAGVPKPQASDAPPADAIASVTSASVDAAVGDLERSVGIAMNATGTPGVAVGVVYGGTTVYTRGFGVRDVDSGKPVDANTVFPLASVSKSIGATVVARAIDEGLVGWDTPVVEHLPGFALSDPWVTQHLTIADLYAHRSGLYEHAGDELEDLGYDRSQVLERLRRIPLDGFRDEYAYGNFDITAAATSVAAAAGKDWADLSDELLYRPLGLSSTSSRFSDLEKRADRARGHIPEGGTWIVNPAQREPDAQSPAGGVSSSITDMTTWMTMLLADGTVDGASFISPAALNPALSPQIVASHPQEIDQRAGYYGYGFNVGTTVGGLVDINHSGAFASGAGTTFRMLPGAGLGIVVLTNGQANGIAEAIAARFMDIAQFGAERRSWLTLYQGVFSKMLAPSGSLVGVARPANPAPPHPLDRYAGVYANDYFGPATVSVTATGLELALGPQGRWPLSPWDGDVFTFALSGENASPGSISKATFSSDGKLVLEFYDGHGLGTFQR